MKPYLQSSEEWTGDVNQSPPKSISSSMYVLSMSATKSSLFAAPNGPSPAAGPLPPEKQDYPQATVDKSRNLVESCLGMVCRHSDRGTLEGGVVLYEWKHFAGGCAPSVTSNISSAQAIHYSC